MKFEKISAPKFNKLSKKALTNLEMAKVGGGLEADYDFAATTDVTGETASGVGDSSDVTRE